MRVFANHVSNKGFICKETTTTQQQKTTNLIKKWEYDLKFSKEDIQVASKHMERCLMSLIIRGNIKTTMRYHLIPTMIATIKKQKKTENNKC